MTISVCRKVIAEIHLELEFDEEVKFLFDLLSAYDSEHDLPETFAKLHDKLELLMSHYA